MRSNELGFSARLFCAQEEIEFDPADAYVGELPTGKVKILVYPEPDRPVAACFVDRKKGITLASLRGAEGRPRYFRRIVNVARGQDGLEETVYPSNAIRIISTPDSGTFRMWEVALISQAGRFFLTCQLMYEAVCLRANNGQLVCPFFEGYPKNWPQLVMVLRRLYADRIEKLPAANGAPATASLPPPVVTGKGRAVVKWYSFARQFGMVYIRSGVAMVHADQISRPGGRALLRFLLPGEQVNYTALRRWRGQREGGSSAFMVELMGVSCESG